MKVIITFIHGDVAESVHRGLTACVRRGAMGAISVRRTVDRYSTPKVAQGILLQRGADRRLFGHDEIAVSLSSGRNPACARAGIPPGAGRDNYAASLSLAATSSSTRKVLTALSSARCSFPGAQVSISFARFTIARRASAILSSSLEGSNSEIACL